MDKNIIKNVKAIIENVKKNKDKAVIILTKKFDKISLSPKNLVVIRAECKRAFAKIDKETLKILETAHKNILDYHKLQRKSIKSLVINKKGSTIKEKIEPIERVGVYIPGGRYPYPSSVFANVCPAMAAGVKDIVVCTPYKNLNDVVKASMYIAGVEKVYAVGGAQAIAAMAYGTQTIPKVDIIVGPGNAYVTQAKRMVYGDVGIDSLAGPSEVVVLADSTANTDYIVEDLGAQAEHDPEAIAYLITDSKSLIYKVRAKLDEELKGRVKCINVKNIDEGVKKANEIAPEHLELVVKASSKILSKIYSAGAIFVGKNTPVALGDYWLGPSHSLPTAGCARFSSGLSVHTFLKRIAVMEVDHNYLKKKCLDAAKFADLEGMKHHAGSIRVRK
ncbi:histidinol dehydrogenase [bacterium]